MPYHFQVGEKQAEKRIIMENSKKNQDKSYKCERWRGECEDKKIKGGKREGRGGEIKLVKLITNKV